MDIKFDYEEILDKLKDFFDDAWQFIQDNSNYFMLGMAILIVILIIALVAKERSINNDDDFYEVTSEPIKRKRKIKYQDIDWGIESKDEEEIILPIDEEETKREIIKEVTIQEKPVQKEETFEVPNFLDYDEIVKHDEAIKEVEAPRMEDIVQIEQINLVKAEPSRKFGPDNIDTSRSGRIFTEEELKSQIRE